MKFVDVFAYIAPFASELHSYGVLMHAIVCYMYVYMNMYVNKTD